MVRQHLGIGLAIFALICGTSHAVANERFDPGKMDNYRVFTQACVITQAIKTSTENLISDVQKYDAALVIREALNGKCRKYADDMWAASLMNVRPINEIEARRRLPKIRSMLDTSFVRDMLPLVRDCLRRGGPEGPCRTNGGAKK